MAQGKLSFPRRDIVHWVYHSHYSGGDRRGVVFSFVEEKTGLGRLAELQGVGKPGRRFASVAASKRPGWIARRLTEIARQLCNSKTPDGDRFRSPPFPCRSERAKELLVLHCVARLVA